MQVIFHQALLDVNARRALTWGDGAIEAPSKDAEVRIAAPQWLWWRRDMLAMSECVPEPCNSGRLKAG